MSNSKTCALLLFISAYVCTRAQENVHALEGLACRKRVALASSPASHCQGAALAAAPGLLVHAMVTKQ